MHKIQSVFSNSRMPLYLQVEALMRQKIQNQQWRVGEQIPTLDELEEEYKVSRITLRASLNRLEEQGIIRRTRGLGTFVVKDLSGERWFKLPNNFDDLVSTVADLKIRLLHLDPEEHAIVPAFNFGKVAKAYHRMRRVHYHQDVPYCLIDIYLEKKTYAQDPDGFSSATVIPALAAMENVEITAGRQIMRVTISDEETAGHLNIGIGDPVADVCRGLLNQDGLLVYYARIQYPAKLIEIETDLFPPKKAVRKRIREQQ
ncbi:GntR family transcriptional regulator [Herbaspirillum sp. GCM10030257]|uniref:GntR family transcriptional regulator n=1 Tax=Herbaspirillum sp. GCM10030257 TaxID=3273393 RepID=UPI00360EAA9A